MPKNIKPHKGTLLHWELHKVLEPLNGLTVYATGIFADHPEFAGHHGHTSMIKSMKFANGKAEIETMNSRYTLA